MDHFNTVTEHLTYKRANGTVTFKNKAYVRSFWETRGIADSYDWLLTKTAFLPTDTSMSVRYFFIEHNIESHPLCVHCGEPINIPKTHSACLPALPTLHSKCVRHHTVIKVFRNHD